LDDGRGIVVGDTIDAVTAALSNNLGRPLPQRLEIRGVFRPKSAVIARLFPNSARRLVLAVKMWRRIQGRVLRILLRLRAARGAGATIESLMAGRADTSALAKQADDRA